MFLAFQLWKPDETLAPVFELVLTNNERNGLEIDENKKLFVN